MIRHYWPALLVGMAVLAVAHLARGGINGATIALVTLTMLVVVLAAGKPETT